MQARGKGRRLFCLTVFGDAAKNFDFPLVGFRSEDIAIGGGAKLARFVETGGVDVHFEAWECLGHNICRARAHLRRIDGRLGGARRRKIGHRHLVDLPGCLGAEIVEDATAVLS